MRVRLRSTLRVRGSLLSVSPSSPQCASCTRQGRILFMLFFFRGIEKGTPVSVLNSTFAEIEERYVSLCHKVL